MDDGCVGFWAKTGVVIVVVFILIFVFAFALTYPVNYFQCEKLQKLNPEFQFQNDWYLGCMINADGMWINADNMRGLTR
jgi:hypothetical protein